MFTHSYGGHSYVYIFQMQIWMWLTLSGVFTVTLSYCSGLSLQQKVKETSWEWWFLPVLMNLSNVSLVGINQSDDFILLGLCFDLRIELNSWPERLMLLIKVSLRMEQKCKELTRRSQASEHPLTPFPGVSWKQRKIKWGTIKKDFMLSSARVSMQIHVENGGVKINMEKKSTSGQSVQVMMITLTLLLWRKCFLATSVIFHE